MRAWKNLPAVCETPPLKATERLARSRHVAAGCGTLILALAILPVNPIASATETGESVRPPQVLAAVPLPTGDAAQNVTNPVTAIPRQPLDWKVMGLIAVAFVAVLLIKVLAKAMSDAKADGKINILDMPKLAPVLIALKAAVDGSDKIAGEIKAASGDIETLTTLLTDALSAMLALVDAVIKK